MSKAEVDSQPAINDAGSDAQTIKNLHKRMKQSSIPLSTGHAGTTDAASTKASDLKAIID